MGHVLATGWLGSKKQECCSRTSPGVCRGLKAARQAVWEVVCVEEEVLT